MPSYDSHDMLAPMLELLFRYVHEEIVRGTRQQKKMDRLWKVVLVLHKEQAEARSLLEEALREFRDQQDDLSKARTGSSRHRRLV